MCNYQMCKLNLDQNSRSAYTWYLKEDVFRSQMHFSAVASMCHKFPPHFELINKSFYITASVLFLKKSKNL